MTEDPGLHPETLLVAASRPEGPGAPLTPPVTFASIFRSGGAYAYGRTSNPTWEALELAVGALEGGDALSFASGMAGATAILDGLAVGARVVAPASGYYEVRASLLERQQAGRLQVELVDLTDTDATIAACTDVDLLWLESPTNPLIGIADLRALIEGAHASGARAVVDNTFATPLLQRPLDLGADAVLHSATKFLSGHGDLVLGVVVTRDEGLGAELARRRSLGGGIPGPMEAFLALRGLRTLAVRLERAQANAAILARRLVGHPAVLRVRYPGLPEDPGHQLAAAQMQGFGALLSFDVHGGAEAADQVCAAARVISYATSLGGVETVMERRTRWQGEVEMGTPPALIRMSVGIEHVEDLWADLERALDQAHG